MHVLMSRTLFNKEVLDVLDKDSMSTDCLNKISTASVGVQVDFRINEREVYIVEIMTTDCQARSEHPRPLIGIQVNTIDSEHTSNMSSKPSEDVPNVSNSKDVPNFCVCWCYVLRQAGPFHSK